MVLAPAAATAASLEQPAGRPPVPSGHTARRGNPETAVRDAITALDIGRLADQVVRQIDRRITAQRERLGRI
jgi:hypothetical protein